MQQVRDGQGGQRLKAGSTGSDRTSLNERARRREASLPGVHDSARLYGRAVGAGEEMMAAIMVLLLLAAPALPADRVDLYSQDGRQAPWLRADRRCAWAGGSLLSSPRLWAGPPRRSAIVSCAPTPPSRCLTTIRTR